MRKNTELFNRNLSTVLFWLIIFVAVGFRVVMLSSVPPNPSVDEVSLGYNAYSLLKTGADEYGEKFPVLLRAYDDWRPALYVYTIIPFLPIFGLTAFAVRIPSVIFSLLTIITIYFLVFELLSVKKNSFTNTQKRYISFLVMFLVVISPWHVYFSRIGHEWNGALSFFVFGFYFFIKYTNSMFGRISKSTMMLLPLSAFCFGLSFNFYQSSKIFIPLFVATLFLLFIKKIFLNKKLFFLSILIGVLVTLPILVASFSPNALIRFNGTNIFSDKQHLFYESAQKVLQAKENNDIIGQILNNRRFIYITVPLAAFMSHLSVSWLFFNSGMESFKVPGFGLLYGFELPFLLIGIIFLAITKKIDKRVKILFLLWFVFAILPASITNGYPHASRIFNIVPLFQILSALGFFVSFIAVRKNTNKYFFNGVMMVTGILVAFFVARFINSYFYQFPKDLSHQFQGGVYEALKEVESYENSYRKVIVSNRDGFFESYMFYLFINKYDPSVYQQMGGTGSGGFEAEHTIGKYEFINVSTINKFPSDTLFVTNPDEIGRTNIEILQKIYYPNGKEAAWISRGIQ